MKLGAVIAIGTKKVFPGVFLLYIAFVTTSVNAYTKHKLEAEVCCVIHPKLHFRCWFGGRLALALDLPPSWTGHHAHSKLPLQGDAHCPVLGHFPGWVSNLQGR